MNFVVAGAWLWISNIIVEAVASTVGMPPQLKLLPRHRCRLPPKSNIDLLSPFTNAIPFTGREAELEDMIVRNRCESTGNEE